ncbi:MAG: 2-phospho-L-lactate transferase, partial [Anaerolineales bacterium]|nr:2-phospho-L-lactate transferase [Anaerolineales bacterium]
MNIVALAGGVGGAKLADGLAQILPPENLTIIVNTGDDFEHLGLKICPDLDTVCYTLAGLANPVTGWGLAGESWNALEAIATLGGPRWFGGGDRDLGTHLERTRRLRAGQSLRQITRYFCRAWGVKPTVLPMSNENVPTIVQTEEGDLAFQEYFVRRQCHPRVKGFRFEGIQAARPAPGVLEALEGADAVVICPSNPWVSVEPILAVPGVRESLGQRGRADTGRKFVGRLRKVVAVSPIIAGQAVKGPAAKMYAELGVEPSALAVARHYGGLLEGFVFDKQDMQVLAEVQALGLRP